MPSFTYDFPYSTKKLPVFADNVVRFERSWYGRDAVTEADLDETARNLRSLQAQEPTRT